MQIMNIQSILTTCLGFLQSIFKHAKSPQIQISDLDEDSEVVTIDNVGITDLGLGAVILKSSDGKELQITAFSAEVAKNISDFQESNRNNAPSMYSMTEQICEESGLVLVKVRIYESGEALRANLYFTGKKEVILRNHRASDALALATFYSIPILIKKSILSPIPKINSRQ